MSKRVFTGMGNRMRVAATRRLGQRTGFQKPNAGTFVRKQSATSGISFCNVRPGHGKSRKNRITLPEIGKPK